MERKKVGAVGSEENKFVQNERGRKMRNNPQLREESTTSNKKTKG